MNLKAQSNKTPDNESLTDPITATNEVLAVLNLKQFTCQAKLLKAPFLIWLVNLFKKRKQKELPSWTLAYHRSLCRDIAK